MQNPWGIEIVVVAGFPLPKMGGLNPEEKDYMADKIRNTQFQEIAPLAEIADLVVEKEKISKEMAIALIRKTLDGNNSADEVDRILAFAIDYRDELSKIRKPELLVERQAQEVAIMILRSRLEPSWILANLDNLKAAFRCSLDKDKCSGLMAIPEERWLSDCTREEIIRAMVRKLPENIYAQITAFALGEEREWAELSTYNEPEDLSLGEPLKGSENIKLPPNQSGIFTEKATTQSNTLASQTPPTTEDDIIASPVG